MLADVKKQQSVLTRSLAISGAAVKASYIIAEKKSVASKPRINEELGEKCLLKFGERFWAQCPVKHEQIQWSLAWEKLRELHLSLCMLLQAYTAK